MHNMLNVLSVNLFCGFRRIIWLKLIILCEPCESYRAHGVILLYVTVVTYRVASVRLDSDKNIVVLYH